MSKATIVPLLLIILSLTAGVRAQGAGHGAGHGNHGGHGAVPANERRQAEVSERGRHVMPFSLEATVHVFTKQAGGGVQRVVARNPDDAAQVGRVRQHLREIRGQFLAGDYSAPARIHGEDMPGLAGLKAAAPGQIAIAYDDVAGGAELVYSTTETRLVEALHAWFDAQLADHGKDAMSGHAHHHGAKRH